MELLNTFKIALLNQMFKTVMSIILPETNIQMSQGAKALAKRVFIHVTLLLDNCVFPVTKQIKVRTPVCCLVAHVHIA